jgi:tetratricopeptide (TPR) repeat protein
MIAIGNSIIGDIFTWLQDYEEALKYYQSGFEANRNPFADRILSYRVSFLQSLISKTQDGLANLDQTIQLVSDQGFILETILGKLSKVFVLYESDHFKELTPLAAEIVEEASQRGLKSIRVIASLLSALIILQQDSQNADQSFEILIQDAQTLSNPLLEITIIMKFCRVYQSMGKVLRVDQVRIKQLLDQLEVCAQEPLIKSSFIAFRISLENCRNPN